MEVQFSKPKFVGKTKVVFYDQNIDIYSSLVWTLPKHHDKFIFL